MKPSNVMLKPNGDVTLIDFGTAREFKNRAMVEDTTCLGTRGYAAPEQFGFSQTDARADIYAMGVLLNEMLIRQHPAKKLAEGVYASTFADGSVIYVNYCGEAVRVNGIRIPAMDFVREEARK
jgi:serine/threonine protein kinase